jgi:hypothetical protein
MQIILDWRHLEEQCQIEWTRELQGTQIRIVSLILGNCRQLETRDGQVVVAWNHIGRNPVHADVTDHRLIIRQACSCRHCVRSSDP